MRLGEGLRLERKSERDWNRNAAIMASASQFHPPLARSLARPHTAASSPGDSGGGCAPNEQPARYAAEYARRTFELREFADTNVDAWNVEQRMPEIIKVYVHFGCTVCDRDASNSNSGNGNAVNCFSTSFFLSLFPDYEPRWSVAGSEFAQIVVY